MTQPTSPQSAWTPGPWEARRAEKPDNTGDYDWAIIAQDKAIIAECFEHVGWRDPGVSYDVRPVEGNARLIAAAPALVEALREARWAVQKLTEALTSEIADNVVMSPLATIDAALARTGQS